MSDPLEVFPGDADALLRGSMFGATAYLLWGMLHDAELADARAAMADLAADEDLRHEAAMRRSEKLRAIGSEATFFSGLARIDGEFRSVRVAVTAEDFVLLDNGRTSIPTPSLHASRARASRTS
jgi:hypothetical protein